MNVRSLTPVLVVMVAIVFGALAFFPAGDNVRLEITGTGDVKLKGTCTANQESVNFNGPIPNTIRAKCRTFAYQINNVTGNGSMTVNVFVNDELKGTITADGENSVIKGTVENGKVSQTTEQVVKK
jgi:hypothetical protein